MTLTPPWSHRRRVPTPAAQAEAAPKPAARAARPPVLTTRQQTPPSPVPAPATEPDPGEAARRDDWPTPRPDYRRRDARHEPLDLDGNLRAANTRLRRQLRDEQDRRERAETRVAELELTLRALGGLVAHAAGHGTVAAP